MQDAIIRSEFETYLFQDDTGVRGSQGIEARYRKQVPPPK